MGKLADYWPIDVMDACVRALDDMPFDDPKRDEATAFYAAASAAREADRMMTVPSWIRHYIDERP